MKKEFEMSMLSELTFFLGLQVYQIDEKFSYLKLSTSKICWKSLKWKIPPMVTGCKLSKDDESLEVDNTMFRSMIGSLLYVTSTRLDVMQVVGLVAIFQWAPKETHVTVVKKIFKYLKGTMEYGLWYSNGQEFTLKAFTDADWAESVDDRVIS